MPAAKLDAPRGFRAPTPAQRKAAVERAEKRAKKNPPALPDGADDDIWIILPPWAGFSDGRSKAASGEVRLGVGGDATGAEEVGPEQRAAYRLVTRSALKNQRMILDAIALAWKDLVRGADVPLPTKVDRAALRDLVSLRSVHIHWAHAAKVAYVGYELACAWDTEHGIGVMTHEDRVVETGHADTAILGWIAERDRKKADRSSRSRSSTSARRLAARLLSHSRSSTSARAKKR
jgi:hypothetical protein